MVKRIRSDALDVVNRALGIDGSGAPVTEFPDGILDQVLDVGSLIRRGRTQGRTTGLYYGVLRNIHAGAGDLTTDINPFNFGTTGLLPPFPTPIPAHFDLWLLSATVQQAAGSGTIAAILDLVWPTTQQAFGIDDSGVAVTATVPITVAHWDTIVTVDILFAVLAGTDQPEARINLRLPPSPNTRILFRTTASAAATFDCTMILGLFPVGLGQDGAI